MIGENSHGTHEFDAARAEITKRLVEDKGFSAIAAEADWPDAYRVNRYVRGGGHDTTAEEALRGFERFPSWMWRNAPVLDFVGWLKEHNDRSRAQGRTLTGFYGLDLYSLHRSMREVVEYLDRVDPASVQRARDRYSCFDHLNGNDGQSYGYAAAFGAGESCEQQVVEQLVELQRHSLEYVQRDGMAACFRSCFSAHCSSGSPGGRSTRSAEESAAPSSRIPSVRSPTLATPYRAQPRRTTSRCLLTEKWPSGTFGPRAARRQRRW